MAIAGRVRAEADRFGLSYVPGLTAHGSSPATFYANLAALNRMETLPWDVWGAMQMSDAGLLDGEKGALFDRAAALTLAGDGRLAKYRDLRDGRPRAAGGFQCAARRLQNDLQRRFR